MCGRYVTVDAEKGRKAWGLRRPPRNYEINYDARPTNILPVLFQGDEGLELEDYRWGLVPMWWKKPLKDLPSTINATAEKIKAKNGMWWTPFLRKRCLVPAAGFYEWQLQPDGKTKVRHYIKLRDDQPMTFAGIWDEWKQLDGTPMRSFAIVTCPANPLMAKIDNNARNSEGPRMPVILTGETAKAWTNPDSGLKPEERHKLLKPFAQEAMLAYPVVRDSKDKAELIKPIGEPVTA